jgi:hypothetical protein
LESVSTSKVISVKPRDFHLRRIVVRNLDSLKQVVIMAGPGTTIDNMKARIQDKFDIPASNQKLVFRERELLAGSIAELFRFEQEEAMLHVRDLRTMQVFIHTLSGRSSLLDVVPSLPVFIVKIRIRTIKGLEHLSVADQRLSFAGRELHDSRLLSDYNIEDESALQLSLRMHGGSMPEVIAPEAPNEPQDEDDDTEQVSNGSREDAYDGDTDDTASANSLVGYEDPTDSENDGGLFNHRAVRVQGLFESYVAPSAHELESDSQATTLRYAFGGTPDDPVPDDPFRGSSAGGSFGTGQEVVPSPEGDPDNSVPDDPFRGSSAGGSFGAGGQVVPSPEGDPDNSVPNDPFRGSSAGGSFGAGGEGEPDGKRARQCEGFQLIVKAVSGKTYILWVSSADTVLMQKITLFHLMGFLFSEPRDLKLVYNGKQLEDDKTLADCGIQDETFVTVVLGMRGGAGGGGMDDSDGDAMRDISQDIPEQVTPSIPPACWDPSLLGPHIRHQVPPSLLNSHMPPKTQNYNSLF